MRLGVCYYPEQWPEARWAVDARLMREAGLDVVRVGEFAWGEMESAENHFTWGWLDRVIDTLTQVGLDVILGTPTATPPVWFTQAHPDSLRVDADGRARAHGSRRHCCPNHAAYRAHSRRIVQALVERYGRHPRVIGWQIDNEFGGGKTARCYCAACAAAFRLWLQARYGSLAALNAAWGNVFWSQTYTDWAQIQPPGDAIDKANPSHALDFYRFCSDSYVSYQQEQIAILRAGAPDSWITHNFMGLYTDLDQFDLAAPLDMAAWDSYPTGNQERWRAMLAGPGQSDDAYAYDVGDPVITGMAHALTYGLKQAPFWVMEQQAGHINWGEVNPTPRPGTVRLWTWHALAAGAEAVLYFRWRAGLFAQEQYHSGLLRHDASPDVGLADLAVLQAERDRLEQVSAESLTADVALLWRFDDLWAIQLQPHQRDFAYTRLLFSYYRAAQSLGLNVAIVAPDADLTPYRLVLAPTLHLADDSLAARLTAWVRPGRTLLLGVRSGFKTESNRVTAEPLPGPLRELAGATVTAWRSLPPPVGAPLTTDVPGLAGNAGGWIETLEPDSAETAILARYQTGEAALTRHALNAGRVYYLGWTPTPAQTAALLTHLAAAAGVDIGQSLPPGLIRLRRGRYLVWLNFTDAPISARWGDTRLTVPGRDVALTDVS